MDYTIYNSTGQPVRLSAKLDANNCLHVTHEESEAVMFTEARGNIQWGSAPGPRVWFAERDEKEGSTIGVRALYAANLASLLRGRLVSLRMKQAAGASVSALYKALQKLEKADLADRQQGFEFQVALNEAGTTAAYGRDGRIPCLWLTSTPQGTLRRLVKHEGKLMLAVTEGRRTKRIEGLDAVADALL